MEASIGGYGTAFGVAWTHRMDDRKISKQGAAARVLFINDTSRSGGPGRTLFYILRFIDPTRIHRTVIIPREGVVSSRIRKGNAAEQILIEPRLVENILEPLSRPIERTDFEAPLLTKFMRIVGNVVRAVLGVRRFLVHAKRGPVDLIFCNGTTSSFVGGILARFGKIPVVWHVLYPSVPAPVRYFHAYLANGKNVRSIICVSKSTALQFDHCRDKVLINHTGLDIEEFDASAITPCLRSELGFGRRAVIFGSHGRIVRKKGYLEMIDAAHIFLETLSREERELCRFVVLGDTPHDARENHLEECRAMVRKLGLETCFHFVGHRPDVRAYVADFDVAVVPSVYPDPLPRAVMESMAMAKAVIAFDMGGIGEMVEDGVSGRLLSGATPDVNGMAEAFRCYFFDEARRALQGAAARRRIESDFSAQKQTAAVEREILRLASYSSGAPNR